MGVDEMEMVGIKKGLLNLLIIIVMCLSSIFCVFADAPNNSDNYKKVKDTLDKQYKEEYMMKVDSLAKARKNRDFLLYLYDDGYLSDEEFQKYVQIGLHGYCSDYVYLYEELKDYERDSSRSSYGLTYLESVASLSMEMLYNAMPDDLRNMKFTETINGDDTVVSYQVNYPYNETDPWYLCPYGCTGEKNSKVAGWSTVCQKTEKAHDVDTDLMCKVRISRTTETGNIEYRDIHIRRDCSAFTSVLLYNLGFDYLWDFNHNAEDYNKYKDLPRFNSYSFANLTNAILSRCSERDKNHFEVLKYSIENLQPGDIVAGGGHVELFMGSKGNTLTNDISVTPYVKHYSWGSTKSVYLNRLMDKNDIDGYLFKAYRYEASSHYNGSNNYGKYTTIIRYTY